jgi:hypothetical protein
MNVKRLVFPSVAVLLTLFAACTHEASQGPGASGGPGAAGAGPGPAAAGSAMPARDMMVTKLKESQVKVSLQIQAAKTKIATLSGPEKDSLDEAVKGAEAKNSELTKKIAELSGSGKADLEQTLKAAQTSLDELQKMISDISAKLKAVK